jgi:hypothetical protein
MSNSNPESAPDRSGSASPGPSFASIEPKGVGEPRAGGAAVDAERRFRAVRGPRTATAARNSRAHLARSAPRRFPDRRRPWRGGAEAELTVVPAFRVAARDYPAPAVGAERGPETVGVDVAGRERALDRLSCRRAPRRTADGATGGTVRPAGTRRRHSRPAEEERGRQQFEAEPEGRCQRGEAADRRTPWAFGREQRAGVDSREAAPAVEEGERVDDHLWQVFEVRGLPDASTGTPSTFGRATFRRGCPPSLGSKRRSRWVVTATRPSPIAATVSGSSPA